MTGSLQAKSIVVLILSLASLLGVFTLQQSVAEDKASALRPYDAKAVEKAQEQGKPVLLVFSKKGCSVCARQDRTLESLLEDGKWQQVNAFKVDYDKEADLKKKHGITSQSTLVGFQGKDETKRVTGETNREKLQEYLNQAFGS